VRCGLRFLIFSLLLRNPSLSVPYLFLVRPLSDVSLVAPQMNRSRQAAITQEIAEIVAGANA
jgi:hypothetical protein